MLFLLCEPKGLRIMPQRQSDGAPRGPQLTTCCAVSFAYFLLSLSCALGANDPPLLEHCSQFRAYEHSIGEDLLAWYDDSGISEALMDRALSERTMINRVPGLPLCIRGGKLYVIDGKDQNISNVWEWQADNIIVYAYALSRLVARWGPSLPDVEFVVETQDMPFQDLAAAGSDAPGGVWSEPHGRLPVMRHCKTASSVDIAVPIFHFYTIPFDAVYLEPSAHHLPWVERKQGAFAAGVSYHRHQELTGTLRAWDGKRQGMKVEMVRESFASYLSEELRHPAITYSAHNVPLREWAAYRMVMHVDGITCSSRLWQLLSLGSVVLREKSGYVAFYDKLLTKFVHYVPFWTQRPREVVWAFNWVSNNTEAAAAIAARGQRFARKYLSAEGVECYWLLLLRQYARLLRFEPGWRGRPRGMPSGASRTGAGGQQERQLNLVPVEEWLRLQDGKVPTWRPNRVAERAAELHLLPMSD